MLFHVLAKHAKRDFEKKKLCFEMRTVTKSNPEQDFFSFMSKRRKYVDALPVLAQNKSIYTWNVHDSPYSFFGRKKSNRSCSMKE